MMQWQVNRQFRKDREAAMARIPNPDTAVQQLDLPHGPPPGLVWPYQENPLIAQIAGVPGHGEIQAGQRGEAFPVQEHEAPVRPECPAPDQPLALLPEPPAVLPYRPRRIDPNPFPPPARGRRGGRGNNLFANNDRNRLGANWRNNPGLEEQEGHREEVLPRPYRAEPMIDYAQPEQGRNYPPINALNDVGALQRMIREMMEPEARRGERPTYRKPYPAYIDQIPLPPELADKASKYEELLREEQQKRNSSKGTYYKSPIHLVQMESEEEAEYSKEGEVAVAEMAKLKHPISCKALTKPPNDQKPPPFTGGCVVFRDVIQEGITAGRLKLAEKSPTVTTNPFPQPQVNMVNLNWPEQKRTRSTTETSSSRDRMVSRETNERPKATISAGMVLCSKCKCEAELEVVLNRQGQPMPSVFDRIGTLSRDRARQEKYPRPAQHNRRMTEQPKKEISIKMPGNDKPLAAIIEGRWYAVGKSGRTTMELTRTQKRRVQRQYCIFLNNKNITQILPETNSARKGKEPEKPPQAEQEIFHSQKMLKTKSPDQPCAHLTSSSDKQLEASQVEGELEPVPAEKQEDWIEENEEEQLDYEPSTDDQNALLEMEGQEDWTEEYGEEQMEYEGELDT
ncbi:unnamed protein product [Prunus brigantina]